MGGVGGCWTGEVQLPPTSTTKVSLYGCLYFHTNQIGIKAYVMSLPVSCYLKDKRYSSLSRRLEAEN